MKRKLYFIFCFCALSNFVLSQDNRKINGGINIKSMLAYDGIYNIASYDQLIRNHTFSFGLVGPSYRGGNQYFEIDWFGMNFTYKFFPNAQQQRIDLYFHYGASYIDYLLGPSKDWFFIQAVGYGFNAYLNKKRNVYIDHSFGLVGIVYTGGWQYSNTLSLGVGYVFTKKPKNDAHKTQ